MYARYFGIWRTRLIGRNGFQIHPLGDLSGEMSLPGAATARSGGIIMKFTDRILFRTSFNREFLYKLSRNCQNFSVISSAYPFIGFFVDGFLSLYIIRAIIGLFIFLSTGKAEKEGRIVGIPSGRINNLFQRVQIFNFIYLREIARIAMGRWTFTRMHLSSVSA